MSMNVRRRNRERRGEPGAEGAVPAVAVHADVGGDGDDDREGDRELAERRGTASVVVCLWKTGEKTKRSLLLLRVVVVVQGRNELLLIPRGGGGDHHSILQ